MSEPISATDERTIKAVENLVVEDRRITIQEIAEILGISSGTVHGILHDHLHMTKVCSTWVPHLLTPVQRHERVEACEELLARYEKEGNDFLSRIITGDESWFYYYQPQNNCLNNGNELTLHHQRSLSKRSQNAKFCILFSGIIMVSF